MPQPTIKDLKTAKKNLRYLIGALDYGIMFYKDNELNLYVFVMQIWVDVLPLGGALHDIASSLEKIVYHGHKRSKL